MRIIQRYLIIAVSKSIGTALLLLAAIGGIIELLREIGEVGNGDYTINAALLYVLAAIPQRVYEFFPMGGLLGSLLGLGVLASRTEITAMRAAGVSLADITKIILKAAIVIAFIISLLGESLIPQLRLWADNYKTFKKSGGLVLATQQGMWVRNGNNFIHINSIASSKHLYGIERYQLDENGQLLQISRANEAVYENNEWQLKDVVFNDIQKTGITLSTQPALKWHIKLSPDILAVAVTEPMQMNLIALYHYIQYRKHEGLATGEYALSFWQRVFQPFATAVMVLIAIPFISGSLRSATMGLKLLLGIVVGFTFYILNQLFGPISLVYQLPPLLAALSPTLILAVVGIYFLKRVR